MSPLQPPTPSTGTPQSLHSQRRHRWQFLVSGSPVTGKGGPGSQGCPQGPPSPSHPSPERRQPAAHPLPVPPQARGASGEQSSSSGRCRGSSPPPRWATREASPPNPIYKEVCTGNEGLLSFCATTGTPQRPPHPQWGDVPIQHRSVSHSPCLALAWAPVGCSLVSIGC